ncbi:hypothetical protein FQ192_31005 [Pseudomonas sp. ANT_J12]|uniref:Uncharacterized protein n=1 Tax=Pseudomonas prosekii TaxID=1148509 RepID=A0A2U2D030_9PSED|nr:MULTISPECIES: hypothetical protein [Pseudomonas]KAA0982694.1 hypothetical protein FQ192_31005 [Pseudomonas sp. ANT_J12]PWE38607.1 hypothetical protein C9I49_27775 [Pseudomonas prosekii]
MDKPQFDHDLSRITCEHYITGKAAINFASPGGTTGGWHSIAYFDRDSGVLKLSVAGIHYPDTMVFFGDAGIFDATPSLVKRGWPVEGLTIYMADHFRAAADMVVRWALSDSQHCNVEIAEWFPAAPDRQRFVDLLASGTPGLQELGRLGKVGA